MNVKSSFAFFGDFSGLPKMVATGALASGSKFPDRHVLAEVDVKLASAVYRDKVSWGDENRDPLRWSCDKRSQLSAFFWLMT
jgi:hypothetical protein